MVTTEDEQVTEEFGEKIEHDNCLVLISLSMKLFHH